MTKEQALQLAPILQAYGEGKVVQWRLHANAAWRDAEECHLWMPFGAGDSKVEWRIKPTPREWWVCALCSYKASHKIEHAENGFGYPCKGEMVHVLEVVS